MKPPWKPVKPRRWFGALAASIGFVLVGVAVVPMLITREPTPTPLTEQATAPSATGQIPSAIDKRAVEPGSTPISYPVLLRRPVLQIARFHFADDFEIVPVYTREGTDLALFPKGDPTVLDRSIGRAGLARRLPDATLRQPD